MSLRVAAYCRVSTDRADQANSLQSQQTYFQTYIEGRAGWRLAGIYADEGLSGTSTRKREAFHRMVEDAEAGRFELILTKEVSRFARNTVDTLEYTRRLKRLGVGVLFLNDNIDTRDNDGELRLTIMASMAQEESRKTSERVKWGQKRRMEAGVVFGNDSTYGFTTRNGALFVKEAEAEVVRLIYQKFLHEGKGTHIIARELYEAGVAPPRAASGKWSCVMVRRILRNEKYVGDLLQKKYITVDYLTHKKEENRGREEMVYLRDHHKAVVDRETWDAVQAELKRRSADMEEGSRYSGRYWCSGKILCGACGSRFVLRKTKRPNGELYRIWGCHSRVHYGNWKQGAEGTCTGCNMRMLNDKTLTACVQYVLGQLALDADGIAAELAEEIGRLEDGPGPTAARLKAQRAEVAEKKERALDAYFSQTITESELAGMRARYDSQLARLDEQLQKAEQAGAARHPSPAELREAIQARLACSEEVYRSLIERVTVHEAFVSVRVYCLPMEFRLWYRTEGRGDAYSTIIERCEQNPL